MPQGLVKMTIPLGQCEHFSQVGPYEKSHFLVMSVWHLRSLVHDHP